MATVRIPSPLRRYTNNQSKVQSTGANISELIENLEFTFEDKIEIPALSSRRLHWSSIFSRRRLVGMLQIGHDCMVVY